MLKWVLDTRPLWPEAKQTRDLTAAVKTQPASLARRPGPPS